LWESDLRNMTQFIFRLNGEYFGFIWQARFFDKKSNYIGWLDGTEVWTIENKYMGELVDNKYILRPLKVASHPKCKGPCPPQAKPIEPSKSENIAPRPSKEDYVDALDDY
jgi:hypothetical protein